MKYFKITVREQYNTTLAGRANGERIPNAEFYFNKIRDGEIIEEAPIFDYFFLESYETQEKWEIIKYDVHRFIGEGSQIKGWLISDRLKKLIEKFDLAEPHNYYLSKFLFRGDKLDYYIFQFSGNVNYAKLLQYIDFSASVFIDPINLEKADVSNEENFLGEFRRIYKKNGLKNSMRIKKIRLKEALDFFPMLNFLQDNLVSERLKNAIEEAGITGFEFSELDYEVVCISEVAF